VNFPEVSHTDSKTKNITTLNEEYYTLKQGNEKISFVNSKETSKYFQKINCKMCYYNDRE
jgi:hypothetical protein